MKKKNKIKAKNNKKEKKCAYTRKYEYTYISVKKIENLTTRNIYR